MIPQSRYVIVAWLRYEVRCPLTAVARTPDAEAGFAAAQDRLQRAVQLEGQEGPYRLWRTPKGPIWMPAGSDGLVPFLLAEQELRIYEEGEVRVRKGDVVLDVGAHVGIYTREALWAGARLVVAIEPSPRNLECLRRNLAAEVDAQKVIVTPKGVWDKEEYLTLANVPYNSGMDHIAEHPNQPGVRVPLTTIDNLVAELQLPRVDFIKMDIEGAERRALVGAQKTLATFRPRLAIASYHLPDDSEAIPRAVRAAWRGYRSRCRSCLPVNRTLAPEVLFFY